MPRANTHASSAGCAQCATAIEKNNPPESRDIPSLQSGPRPDRGPHTCCFLSQRPAGGEGRGPLAACRHMAWDFCKHVPLSTFPNCSKFFPPPPFLREGVRHLPPFSACQRTPLLLFAGLKGGVGSEPRPLDSAPASLARPCGDPSSGGKNTLSLPGFQREDGRPYTG